MGGLPPRTVNGFAVHPSNPKVMYVAMSDGVSRSDDAGERWTRFSQGPKNVGAVAVNPRKPTEVYIATTDGQIFVSDDDGSRWELRP